MPALIASSANTFDRVRDGAHVHDRIQAIPDRPARKIARYVSLERRSSQ
jgi:hypothetical protein